MIANGYVKGYKYAGDGSLLLQVRIPSIHGPMYQAEYQGKPVKNYVRDSDLPYYPSVLLPHLPGEGEVVILSTTNEKSYDFIVLGLTGGSYYNSKVADEDSASSRATVFSARS